MTPLERLRRLVGEDGQQGPSCPDGAMSCPESWPDGTMSCPDGTGTDGADGAPCACPTSQRELTDEQLQALLDECGGDVAVAAYQALLYKSRNSGLTLASGLRLPDQSAHYRRLARLYRPQGRGTLRRADEGRDGP